MSDLRDALKRSIAELEYCLDHAYSPDVTTIKRLKSIAALAQPEAVEPLALVWRDGAPPKPWADEWFIARTTFNDRVVLTALPEEYSYDFKTADDTYIKADRIKQWMQFPDSQFIAPPLAQPEAVEPDASARISNLAADLVVSGWMATEHGIEETVKRAEQKLLDFACNEIERHMKRRSTPPLAPDGERMCRALTSVRNWLDTMFNEELKSDDLVAQIRAINEALFPRADEGKESEGGEPVLSPLDEARIEMGFYQPELVTTPTPPDATAQREAIELKRLRSVAWAAQGLLNADTYVSDVPREQAVSCATVKLRQALGTWQAHHTASRAGG